MVGFTGHDKHMMVNRHVGKVYTNYNDMCIVAMDTFNKQC
jgi:hypothetical protein